MTKILVIDDKKDNLISIKALLKHLEPDYEVLTAQSGIEGIKLAKSKQPDTILLDIQMPRIDGYEVCRRLRADKKTRLIPIIFLTAVKTSSKDRIKGLELGGDAYLTKPIDEGELLANLHVMLRIKKVEDELKKEKDLLEVKVAERTRELQESEAKYIDLYENASDMFVSVDIKTSKIIRCNQTLADVLGYNKDEIIGQSIFFVYHPDCLEDAKKAFQQFVNTGEIHDAELQLKRKDGSKMDVSLNVSAVRDAKGKVLYSSSILRDITERKQAEQFFKKSLLEMTVLNTLGQQVSSGLSIDNVVQSAMDAIVDLMRPDMVLFFLRDKNKLFIRGEKYANPKFRHKVTPVHKVGECLCGVAVREKRAIYSININHDPRCTWKECKEAGFTSFAALPMRSGGEIIGVLGIGSVIERDLSEQATFLETVSNHIAISLQNADYYEKLQDYATKLEQEITERKQVEKGIQRHVKEMTTIYDAARKLQQLHTPDALAQELISILEQIPHFEFGAVLLIDESTGALMPFALSDQGRGAEFVEMDKDFVSNKRISIGQGITGWVAQAGQSIRLGDVRSDSRYQALRKDIRSELCVPLQAENHVIGVLNVETTKPDAYTESDQRVLETIASQMALAIQQSYLHERIERHATDLEQRVQERTAELEEKTKSLANSRKSLTFLLEDVNESRANLDITNKKLEASNKELEAFSYSVSHDLRAPLRAIDGFTNILMEDYVTKLDDEGKRLGSVIRQNAQQMSQLIDDLLDFSRLGRTAMNFTEIDMQSMANAIYHETTSAKERKRITFTITDLSKTDGDTNMMRLVWMNLISNALKFSDQRKQAVILVTCQEEENKLTYCIKDNGAGFNMKYKDKLFDVFQRLHSEKEFKGTGVGLALVQRIIHRHSGEVWAKGEVDHGAAFYFSLPKNRSTKNGT